MPGTGDRELVFPAIPTAITAAESVALGRLAQRQTILELGAFFGYSTILMASVADMVYSIDWHQGDDHAGQYNTWNEFRANIMGYRMQEHVTAIKGRFEEEVPKLWRDGVRVDGAFLDGQHDYESVKRDLELALLVVKPGGWIAFHDYGRNETNGHPGFEVTKVADEFGIDGTVGFFAWGTVPETVPE